MTFFFFDKSDSNDFDFYEMWQAEKEKEWREKTGRKHWRFSGIDKWLLPNNSALDYE